MQVPWVDPITHDPLERRGDALHNARTGALVAPIVLDIPRFVAPSDNYAESFAFQWKTWASARSDVRNPGHDLKSQILERTGFDRMDLSGKTLLECGMGGGDDTEILVQLPLAEIHSFDLSTSVERARQYIRDDRLFLSQASIFDIPYPDGAFDVVYCHRVLQHTPDPVRALRSICRKVKLGGLLFAHAYKRSCFQMSEWRYKYRWLTKRLPWTVVYTYVMKAGPFMHRLVHAMHRTILGRRVAHRFVPFYHMTLPAGSRLSDAQLLEMEQHITFDALTPRHDHPMTTHEFRKTIESEGFEILHLMDPETSPLWCTARRIDR